ncbi:Mov34/MPN/PAD-1 family protein [Devosia rhizoryzae]|uniref:Mov34/MPN/PAD-1 family protein n=1 Tax=Devosia rhizoryzae TaxID=2774137 RepID=A0ABX7CA55_9HYPH|nr:Mov34/MPN/PAD-1 family protein [Devosia rhizoryzae]
MAESVSGTLHSHPQTRAAPSQEDESEQTSKMPVLQHTAFS